MCEGNTQHSTDTEGNWRRCSQEAADLSFDVNYPKGSLSRRGEGECAAVPWEEKTREEVGAKSKPGSLKQKW